MTPLQAYHQKILEKALQADPQQEMAMRQLQQVYDALLAPKKWIPPKKTIKGLYLWGKVGRGKTYLMDLFYHQLTIPKCRYHFHQFMQYVHRQLIRLQGHTNPLKRLTEQLANKVKIICLDEFLVHEIGDAMLLFQLLQALFQQDITLVTTANTPPDALYEHGLQRDRFLPAIALIKNNLTIFELSGPTDYRRQPLTEIKPGSDSFLEMSSEEVQQLFDRLREKKTVSYEPLSIEGRPITHLGCTDNLIWFNFRSICTVPRSQIDYLMLAERFSIILISNVHPIGEDNDNLARLFIHLVDVLYDAGTTLILTTRVPIIDIYPKGRFIAEFERIKSRLVSFQKMAMNRINTIDQL